MLRRLCFYRYLCAMRNNYDAIAPWYDKLSRLVFGKAQVHAQTALLTYIPPGSKVLIIGGGSGWILEELAHVHPSGLQITYVEISAKMLELSRRRHLGGNKIRFVQQAVEDFSATETFDVVFTPFLFDNFTTAKAQSVFDLLHALLRQKGLWMFVDFQYSHSKNSWWQKILLHTMLAFFKIVSRIEATTLVNMEPIFAAKNYRVLFNRKSFGSFIHSTVYEKP